MTRRYGTREDEKLTSYIAERKRTGICDTCGKTIIDHLRCEACGLLIGESHFDGDVTRYREHALCWYCISMWERCERQEGKEIGFRRYAHAHLFSKTEPKPQIGRPRKRKRRGRSVGRPRTAEVYTGPKRPVGRPKKQHGEYELSIKGG